MAECKRVLFSTSSNITYMFDEDGVWRKRKAEVTDDDIPSSDSPVKSSSHKVWSIIDGNTKSQSEEGPLTSDRVFTLLAASPNESRYEKWVWRNPGGVLIYILNPWTVKEVSLLYIIG